MAGSLESVLANVPGLAGYLAAQQNDQQRQMGQIQQLGGLQGILEAAQNGPLKRQLLEAQVAEHQQAPDLKRAALAQTKEMALARLDQTRRNGDQLFQLRFAAAKSQADRDRIAAEHKAFADRVTAERLKYDTGAVVEPPAVLQAPDAATQQPAGSPNEPTFRYRDPNNPNNVLEGPQAAQAIIEQLARTQGASAAPAQPAPSAAPSVAPAAPVAAPGASPLPAPNPQPAPSPVPAPGPVMPPEIARLPKKYQDAWAAKQAGAETAKLSPEALGPMAWEKLLFGTDAKGLGNASAAQRAQVNEMRARLGKSLGLSDTEIAMLPQDNKVKMKAVDKLTTWGAFVDKAADQLIPSIDLAISYAGKLDQTQLQHINKAIIAGRTEFNDPAANAYAVAVNTVRREYGRLMSGPTSNAMLPVEAMKGADNLISTALDVPAWNEVKSVILRDAAITKESVQKQISSLRGGIQVPGAAAPAPAAPAAAPKVVDFGSLK